jgi:hypothetical protein
MARNNVFFPFGTLTLAFPKNWQLTLGLNLIASLMNDLFYGIIRNLLGFPLDLSWYSPRTPRL